MHPGVQATLLAASSWENACMFSTQAEARRFFADKAIHQAEIDGMPLSDDERQTCRSLTATWLAGPSCR
jgi:hypothetical protein